MTVIEAQALMRFLIWEKNRHLDDIRKIEDDIFQITQKYPELKEFVVKHQYGRGFLEAGDV